MTDEGSPGDSEWSRRHAETGGWPPPAPDQHPYAPGTPQAPGPGQSWSASPADADQSRPPADQSAPGAPWAPGSPATGGTGAGPGGTGAGPGGTGSAPWAPGGTGTSGPGAAPWAPGDSAYGRLSGPPAGPAYQPTGGRPRRQRPPRPWDDRPEHPPRPVPRPSAGRGAGTPVTFALIAACVLGFLLQEADPTITVRYGLLPAAVEGGQYERLITAAFLHAGVLHLATNMFTLYIVGTPLERVLHTGRYLTVYLLSALGGSLLSLWLSPDFSVGVGASGAIFGLFGALLVLRRQVGADARGLGVLIGINLVISFAVPNVSWQAHIGGLITGLLVALVLAALDRARRRST